MIIIVSKYVDVRNKFLMKDDSDRIILILNNNGTTNNGRYKSVASNT